MKKVIIGATLLLFCQAAFSQQNTPAPQLTKQEYLQKSKQQKTAAWLLLGGGTALTIAGGAVVMDNFKLFQKSTGSVTGDIMMVSGLVAMGSSIPLFIAASRNKRKAAAITAGVKLEQNTMVWQYVLFNTYYPALTVSIQF